MDSGGKEERGVRLGVLRVLSTPCNGFRRGKSQTGEDTQITNFQLHVMDSVGLEHIMPGEFLLSFQLHVMDSQRTSLFRYQ